MSIFQSNSRSAEKKKKNTKIKINKKCARYAS